MTSDRAGGLLETTGFEPPAGLRGLAAFSSRETYRAFLEESWRDSQAFWERSLELLRWDVPPVGAGGPGAWFPGGRLNPTRQLPCLAEEGDEDRAVLISHSSDGTQGEPTSAGALRLRVGHACGCLARSGLAAGQRVFLCYEQGPALVAALLACMRSGLSCVVADPGVDAAALARRAANTKCVAIWMDPGLGSAPADALRQAVPGAAWLDPDAMDATGTAELPAPVTVDAQHPAFVVENSSGQAFSLPAAGFQLQARLSWKYVFSGLERNDAVLLMHPGRHSAFLSVLLAALAHDSRVHLFPRPEEVRAGGLLGVLQGWKPRMAAVWARLLIRMAGADEDLPQETKERPALLVAEGTMLPPHVYAWTRDKLLAGATHLTQAISRPECGGYFVGSYPPLATVFPSCAGLALPGKQVMVVDRAGQPVAPHHGGKAELERATPATALEMQTEGSRVPTGVLARRDADGRLWTVGEGPSLDGRDASLPKLPELEARILMVPDVQKVAVVRYRDEKSVWHQRAFVALEASPEEVIPRIRQALERAYAGEQIAMEFQVVEDFPVTGNGKMLRSVMQRVAIGELEGLLEHTPSSNPETIKKLISERDKTF